MRRDPPITFRGALKILGHHDRPWLDRLNTLLGGAILAAGPVGLDAVWQMVDQKSEAVALLSGALDSFSDRLAGTHGLHRQDLAVAAHSTIVLAAYFEAAEHHLGTEFSHADRIAIADVRRPEDDSLVHALYQVEIPTPSIHTSFEMNQDHLVAWADRLLPKVLGLLKFAGDRDAIRVGIRQDFIRRYLSSFIDLAATIPEFGVWSDRVDRAHTQHALAHLTALLAEGQAVDLRDHRALVDQANQSELGKPVVNTGTAVPVFPTTAEIFQTPRYRLTVFDWNTRIGEESWWDEVPVHNDLTAMLARHFCTPLALTRPLLLLGHPGAGKSLLMTVLAAVLPSVNYTVVRVQLRHVNAGTTVLGQVEQALEQATNRRVDWPSLDDGAVTVRVVLLDGLDELLQATAADRTGYLRDVEQFQRTEAAMGYPVAVVVTSRTLVADRVLVPHGTPVVKIEEFDDDQIEGWIKVWNAANTQVGSQPLPLDTALSLPQFARQPLLLMMLAVYCAEPGAVLPDASMSLADLYDRLLTGFARREVVEKGMREDDPPAAIQRLLRRLSVAALGMLNRGKQFIAEADLSADLIALGDREFSGDRVLTKFFFIHAPEARVGDSVVRGYEFLHATFGEYLVADRVVEVLRDVAESAYGRRHEHEPDDELLYALLSHQPLTIQRPTIDFIVDRIGELGEPERGNVVRTLDQLLRDHRNRTSSSRYQLYQVNSTDLVARLAAYSANLVLLRVYITGGLDLTGLVRQDQSADGWNATVRLWEAGLDLLGVLAMVTSLRRTNWVVVPGNSFSGDLDVALGLLRDAPEADRRFRVGMAATEHRHFQSGPGDRVFLHGLLLSLLVGTKRAELPLPHVELGPRDSDLVRLAELVLINRVGGWGWRSTQEFVEWLLTLSDNIDPVVLLVVDRTYPGMIDDATLTRHGVADIVQELNPFGVEGVDIAIRMLAKRRR
ncbi:NACHT domain-containing protein [Actinokineospora inagensis]|uniref:NACHT domain-containing protein n=1 Tax=Actinokineospora inagensis TaxID=103730 RepID=UPI0004027304|nr:AAA family ATPase [Actinokineospora inagensis]